jgi:hypothetical protein
VWFESEDGGVKSNTVAVESVTCTGANVTGIPDRLLLQGEHLPIKVTYTTEGGSRDDLLHDAPAEVRQAVDVTPAHVHARDHLRRREGRDVVDAPGLAVVRDLAGEFAAFGRVVRVAHGVVGLPGDASVQQAIADLVGEDRDAPPAFVARPHARVTSMMKGFVVKHSVLRRDGLLEAALKSG